MKQTKSNDLLSSGTLFVTGKHAYGFEFKITVENVLVLTETQVAVQTTVRAFARKNIAPNTRKFEAEGGYPASMFQELAELGIMGMIVPEAFGGANLDYVSYALALIELAAGDGALSTIVSIQNSIFDAGILAYGSEAQKARFLPELTSGRCIGAFALTESDAGSDAAAIRTRATKVPGGWRINGAKQFITSGRSGGLAMIIAVTNPEKGSKGISAFLVPTDRSGYIVDKVEHKLGQAASDTCAIRFDDLFVEDDLLLGPEDQGYRIALSNLEAGRIGIGAQSVGMADAAISIATAYARDRRSMGKPIIEHQAIGFKLADMAARLEAARQLVLHAASLKDAGQPCLKEAAMAKLVASETAEWVVSGCIQVLGGYGYLEEFGISKIYRDVKVCQIYEGTSEIQRMIIARAL